VANEIGALLGWLALTGTSALVIQRHPGEPGWLVFGGAAIVALSGGILGAIQRAVLRPRIPVVGWVVATAIGMGLGFLLFLLLVGSLSLAPRGSVAFRLVTTWMARSVVNGGVYGLSTGACQWLVGRRRGLAAWSWLTASALGLAVGGFCTTVVRGAIPGGRTPGDVRSMAIGPLVNGLVYGLATAAVLRRSRPVHTAASVHADIVGSDEQ
jgi:hypothetical protein